MPIEHSFNPYGDSSGGSTLAIAGKDFAILAGDTRHSTGYSIDSRNESQIHSVGDGLLVSPNGFSADARAFVDDVHNDIIWYHHKHNKKLAISSCARSIMHTLYRRRFFPYYVSPILVGIEPDGTGAVYSFDPVGSYEREASRAAGHASELLVPFLDNQVRKANQVDPETGKPLAQHDLDLETALQLVKDAFAGAAERRIQVGDWLEIAVVTKDGHKVERYPLRRD
ncbi:Proteasome subunit beta type-6 [Wickerhamiella sorbophila]|uniref:Proteasome subunit beta type-6 n=1 Tax=Wickerhamiella sorbophila TaxID=45607 RepID=A0A2T0FPK9_9ASCO|nr:Proteasome subunit beta type-6 [Wickerhamiella sorbophila]PRT56933.1 Proteasome subunit beta type-6 [Wickerhamiella sorbophila]